MKFINTYSEETYTLAEIVTYLERDCELRREFLVFIMDCLNGRNDIHIIGFTPSEVNRLVARLQKSL